MSTSGTWLIGIEAFTPFRDPARTPDEGLLDQAKQHRLVLIHVRLLTDQHLRRGLVVVDDSADALCLSDHRRTLHNIGKRHGEGQWEVTSWTKKPRVTSWVEPLSRHPPAVGVRHRLAIGRWADKAERSAVAATSQPTNADPRSERTRGEGMGDCGAGLDVGAGGV